MRYLLPWALPFLLLACTPPAEPLPQVQQGQIVRLPHFPSRYVSPRHVDIWLPPGYDSTQRYPVLYLHDGQMLYDSTQSWNGQEWGVDETLARLIAQDSLPPCIVAGIWNVPAERHADYFPQAPFEALPPAVQDSLLALGWEQPLFATPVKSDAYLRFIVEELKPQLDARYPTRSGPAHTFIGGSSMGGLISWYALCRYPEVFGGAACLSTHWPGTFTTAGNPIPAAFLTYLKQHLPPAGTHRLYFDHGTETLDSLYAPFQVQADSILRQAGYGPDQAQSLVFPGTDHSERAWQARLSRPLTFLLAPRK